jgi:hypothetical protein
LTRKSKFKMGYISQTECGHDCAGSGGTYQDRDRNSVNVGIVHLTNMRLRRAGSSRNRPPYSKEPTTETVDPWCRGSAPDLPPRLEPVALADTPPANPPVIWAARAAGEKRRTAFRAEMLKARSAVISGLGVDLGHLPRHPDLFARADHRDPVGRSGQHLAIRAVTDRYSLGIDVGLISYRTAMALPVDIHLI